MADRALITVKVDGARAKRKLVPYTDSAGNRHWVEMDAADARELDLFDRNMRRRERLYREHIRTETDLKAEGPRRVKRGGRLVGYLNFELEDGFRPFSLSREEGYPWEGPRFDFTLLLGESPSWDGPDGMWKFGTYASDLVTRRTVVIWEREPFDTRLCRFCGHMPKLPHYAACLNPDCNRTGQDARIGKGLPRTERKTYQKGKHRGGKS